MRQLSSARIVVLDADPDHRTRLCTALAALGMTRVLAAASAEDARALFAAAPPDLCVVDMRGLAREAPARIPQNPFTAAGTPGILIAADASGEASRAASASGYAALLAAPVAPRTLYRRIGSVLQKARRAGRRNAAAIVADAAMAGTELRDT